MNKIKYYISFKSADGLGIIEDMGENYPAPVVYRRCIYPIYVSREEHTVLDVPSLIRRKYVFYGTISTEENSILLEYREEK